MNTKTLPTFWVKIYMAGDINHAKQLLRTECMRKGLCATIEPTTFIYTGGEELGFVVGLIDYPRFPSTTKVILKRAEAIAAMLLKELCQLSVLIQTPTRTKWITTRLTP